MHNVRSRILLACHPARDTLPRRSHRKSDQKLIVDRAMVMKERTAVAEIYAASVASSAAVVRLLIQPVNLRWRRSLVPSVAASIVVAIQDARMHVDSVMLCYSGCSRC